MTMSLCIFHHTADKQAFEALPGPVTNNQHGSLVKRLLVDGLEVVVFYRAKNEPSTSMWFHRVTKVGRKGKELESPSGGPTYHEQMVEGEGWNLALFHDCPKEE